MLDFLETWETDRLDSLDDSDKMTLAGWLVSNGHLGYQGPFIFLKAMDESLRKPFIAALYNANKSLERLG